ncbi:uncharacterized protein BX663DRAFT_451381 [Cokeromyces recurvatus]|uniref:uncharacterized protein n=1 Tax=Cokeromyces recurvatus TaxID=90255 RepID=UPI002220A55D|nr:uncharacterized protein BX663DRAFT_451381 [Cokeromyces recurvatus]KAI7904746.1 hypothetical protein BX663DRAFT_451381 [Cokeromyces recurvatus]
MIILRHNTLLAKDLFLIERIMLKISENPSFDYLLDYSLLNKSRGEVYGYIAGIFKRIGICHTLGITTSDFLDLLIDIERGYNDNPYHSFYHAVDVAMVLYHMLEKYDMKEYLNRFDLAMLMIAALCHDIGHPGNNNHFEIACQTKRAQRYNNLSVLESYSSQLTLELLDKHKFLRHVESRSKALGCPMSCDDFKKSIVETILATDMICHFTLQENIHLLHDTILQWKKKRSHQDFINFKTVTSSTSQLKPLFPPDAQHDPLDYFNKNYHFKQTINDKRDDQALNGQERLMICKILIHAADISNPCRPWPIFHQLSLLVCVEFFRQGEQERALGLDISPNMDPNKANPSKINIGFIDFIVQPYFEALAALFPKSFELVEVCQVNRKEWLKLSTETVDGVDLNLISIEETMGAIPRKHVTVAAGTVQIPESIEEDIIRRRKRLQATMFNRSISFNSYCSGQLLSPILHEDASNSTTNRCRRKSSEEVIASSLHRINRFHRNSISKTRRKSDELSSSNMLNNHPKIIPFF